MTVPPHAVSVIGKKDSAAIALGSKNVKTKGTTLFSQLDVMLHDAATFTVVGPKNESVDLRATVTSTAALRGKDLTDFVIAPTCGKAKKVKLSPEGKFFSMSVTRMSWPASPVAGFMYINDAICTSAHLKLVNAFKYSGVVLGPTHTLTFTSSFTDSSCRGRGKDRMVSAIVDLTTTPD